ncbi:MAG: AAA family ATPase [Chloroflexi bacterium]|nr:AAA family ATPase [Chloroflexota bacterium]
MSENPHAISYSSFEDIVDAIRSAAIDSADSTLLIGIDGAGGSGKSTLAKNLSESLDGATVIRLDDFADWSDDSNWELSTFAERVLIPFVAGITSKHQRYDWPTDSLGEWFEIPSTGIAIVEGVTALRPDLRGYWHVSIWVDCPRELRLERGVSRDGEEIRSKWVNEWMPGEDAYFERDRPSAIAQFIFDGSRQPESNFNPPA